MRLLLAITAATCYHFCYSKFLMNVQGGPNKRGHELMAIVLSNLRRFLIFTVRFFSKFSVKWLLKINHTLHVLPHYLVKH